MKYIMYMAQIRVKCLSSMLAVLCFSISVKYSSVRVKYSSVIVKCLSSMIVVLCFSIQ